MEDLRKSHIEMVEKTIEMKDIDRKFSAIYQLGRILPFLLTGVIVGLGLKFGIIPILYLLAGLAVGMCLLSKGSYLREHEDKKSALAEATEWLDQAREDSKKKTSAIFVNDDLYMMHKILKKVHANLSHIGLTPEELEALSLKGKEAEELFKT